MAIDYILPEDKEKQNMLQIGVQHAHSRNPVVSYLASLGSKEPSLTTASKIACSFPGNNWIMGWLPQSKPG